jgi:alanyl-tRNA synthetase
LYGPFGEYKSFGEIIKIEYERWSSTEDGQKKKIEQLVSKKKGKLTLDDWITGMQAWGIPADVIAEVAKTEVPGNLYNEIDKRAAKVAKAQ